MQIRSEQGYLIPAFNTPEVDYVSLANQLATSIRRWHPDADIEILTTDKLPFGDQGGFANDWQVFYASPFRQTIKLEADMLASSPIDHYWTMFEKLDLVISTGCRDFYDRVGDSGYYRKIFINNELPDVYNAITYWRRSQTAQEFFACVRQIFENWDTYKTVLKYPDDTPTTDVVYAMAALIVGVNKVCLPTGLGPNIVHMKKNIIGTQTENWTNELVWEFVENNLRINTVTQYGFVHYHIKDWLS